MRRSLIADAFRGGPMRVHTGGAAYLLNFICRPTTARPTRARARKANGRKVPSVSSMSYTQGWPRTSETGMVRITGASITQVHVVLGTDGVRFEGHERGSESILSYFFLKLRERFLSVLFLTCFTTNCSPVEANSTSYHGRWVPVKMVSNRAGYQPSGYPGDPG